MGKPIIFLFPGQGCQYYQMGRELFNQPSTFRKWMLKCDIIVRDLLGFSLTAQLYDESRKISESFDDIRLSHPAIFSFEYALAQELMARGIEPNYVLGASLGEYTAATIAGIIDFEEALTATIGQAKIIDEKCAPGSMIAILDHYQLYETIAEISHHSELAAIHFDNHFVVSTARKHKKTIEDALRSRDIISQPLTVSYGFHSSNIDDAYSSLQDLFSKLTLKPAKINLISCENTRCTNQISFDHLWKVARNPIMFQKTIQLVENSGRYNYIDIGPSGTLANFVKYNLTNKSTSRIFAAVTPFNALNSFDRLQQQFGVYLS